MNWAWDYFLFERAVRLILPREWVLKRSALDPTQTPPAKDSGG